MLRALSIREIVLIERLDLEFQNGLNVLTGETGAGKSILMDALGFALGRKVRRDLLRAGASDGSVTATFEIDRGHPVEALLAELDLPLEDGELILRRAASAEGPSRAFVNDRRVSADALGRIGALLVEVHGQHDDRGLLNARAHRPLLDQFGELGAAVERCRGAWRTWRDAVSAVEETRTALADAATDADFLRHSLEELEALAPEAGEDEQLDAERRLIKQAGNLTGELAKASAQLSTDGAEGALGEALGRLTSLAPQIEGRLDATIDAIDRTLAELAEAQAGLTDLLDALQFDPGRLEEVEDRLFAIRGLARKHDVQPDDLGPLIVTFRTRLEAIDTGDARLAELESAARDAEDAYLMEAVALTDVRRAAAACLDTAITAELAPLKMEAARFTTEIATAEPGPEGQDQVRFTAAINPGAPAGAIDRIASGGELSRFLLAIKVCLAARASGLTMIFDEIDRGVGGATADAVGRRLARLSGEGQVLVVTHSPQVAAQGDHHWRIAKSTDMSVTRTDVTALDRDDRTDEIARMLAGDHITEEARSAARALLSAS
ncbi:MAG: DNA repair protein RecN [Pseudomonadota bacterium]